MSLLVCLLLYRNYWYIAIVIPNYPHAILPIIRKSLDIPLIPGVDAG